MNIYLQNEAGSRFPRLVLNWGHMNFVGLNYVTGFASLIGSTMKQHLRKGSAKTGRQLLAGKILAKIGNFEMVQ